MLRLTQLRASSALVAALIAVSTASCAGSGTPESTTPPSGIHIGALTATGTDVTGILYEIFDSNGNLVASQFVGLEDEALPPWLAPAGAGGGHAFADLFNTLPPGKYKIVATPMKDPRTPSEDCKPVSTEAEVFPGRTTEVVMIAQCEGDPKGGLDVVTGLNQAPVIDTLTIGPSKFITMCQLADLNVTAHDPEGDALTYTWAVVSTPIPGATYTLTQDGTSHAQFFAETPGAYTLSITVTDALGGHTTLTFPIHVSATGNIEHCQDVCCKLDTGFASVAGPLCEAQGGVEVAAAFCSPYVCCKLGVAPLIVLANECPATQVLPIEDCRIQETNCCRLPDGDFTTLPMDECRASGGVLENAVFCRETCCQTRNADGTVTTTTTTVGECVLAGGTQVAADLCQPDDVCCVKEQGTPPVFVPADQCRPPSIVVADERCGSAHQFETNFTLDASEGCDPEPYLVVPSSGDDKLAVYDLTTLAPLGTTPFPTCDNPSRILMDANTDVIATCRDDGKVNKHTRDGVLLWSTQLPGCTAARGVGLAPNNRLFVSCTSPATVYELHPGTGAVLKTAPLTGGSYIYGLTVDAQGIYVCDRGTGVLTKMYADVILGASDPNDMTIAWQVSSNCYGLNVEGSGAVWTAEPSNLRAQRISTATGVVTNSVPLNNSPYPLIVALDGNVYVGLSFGAFNGIARIHTDFTTVDYLANVGADSNAHGVTVDAAGNAYAINYSSSTLARFSLANVVTSFGGGVLNYPYGYSGDMTGITQQCLTNFTDTWESLVFDTGNPASTFGTATWTANVPAGTTLTLYYRVNGGAWTYLVATSTGTQTTAIPPPNVGQTIQFKAVATSIDPVNFQPSLTNLVVTY